MTRIEQALQRMRAGDPAATDGLTPSQRLRVIHLFNQSRTK